MKYRAYIKFENLEELKEKNFYSKEEADRWIRERKEAINKRVLEQGVFPMKGQLQ